eukprot:774480-Alexandrium_andersonii.AAC.1
MCIRDRDASSNTVKTGRAQTESKGSTWTSAATPRATRLWEQHELVLRPPARGATASSRAACSGPASLSIP